MQRICGPFVLKTTIMPFKTLLGPVYMEWWTPVQWGWFLLFSRSGEHKTKETYPTRPGSPTPCKQALSPVTLAHQIFVFYSSLYFYTSNTFRPILARFSHILLYTNFILMYITTRNILLIPDDVFARNLIIIFNFSRQRPHLNYIFLSNVYSFDTMEFSMKHKC